MRLDGKVALITGAGSGIGRASAIRFAREGARVLAVDIDSGAVKSLATEINYSDGHAVPLVADVSKPKDCERMVNTAERYFHRLDILFNNAGIIDSADSDPVRTDLAVWKHTLSVNLTSVFLGCKYGIPMLLKTGGGVIINSSSMSALMGSGNPAVAYTASKGGILAMTREIAVAYGKQNIRANALCPGPLKTEFLMNHLRNKNERERRLVHLPEGRFGEPEEVAEAAVFLASDESSLVNASAFVVDGGASGAYVTAL